MSGFAELFTDTEGLVFFVFILVSVSIYMNGGSYSDSMLISGLGLIKLIPLFLLKSVAASSPLLAIPCALAFLWFVGELRQLVGTPVYALITVATIILLIGG